MSEPADRLAGPPRRRDAAAPEPSAQRHDALERRAAAQAATGYGALLSRRPAGPCPVQRAASTGLPAPLKAGVEALSGVGMEDVKVHHGSAQPARLQAHAFTQGTDIHLAPGQEGHLPHEAWHVVQQAQGRVRPTMQMKGGVAINEDAGLEREADVMGSRAAALGRAQDRGAPAVPPRPAPRAAGAPVQRYKVREKFHISNDDTAAVVDVRNNKELYATAERIEQAKTALRQRVSNISLNKGKTIRTHANKNLIAVQPEIDTPNVEENVRTTGADASLTPLADKSQTKKTGVLLPAECERGAIAIIGTFIKDQKVPANTFDYAGPAHAKARIANLIAQSTAGAQKKKAWYDEWLRVEALVEKATDCHGLLTQGGRIVDGPALADVRAEVRKTHAGVADNRFAANFKLDQTAYVPKTGKAEAKAVIEDMIRLLDARLNLLEREVMSDVDVTYRGYDEDVLRARNLRTQLIQLYAAKDFPKATIDAALNLAGEQANLAKYFAIKKDDPQAYANNLNYMTESRMTSFLEELVAKIGTEILRLETRRDKQFGSVGNQNKAVDPDVGQAYGIVGGHYNLDKDKAGRWNWHWAGVVLKTDSDNVTMEAHASQKQGNETHNENWDFKMYGRPQVEGNEGKTFHEIWRDRGFGQAPVTVVGEPITPVDPKIVEFHLDRLTLIEVAKYRKGANNLFSIIDPMSDMKYGKNALVPYFYGRTEKIAAITAAELPQAFVEERLREDLERQAAAMARLKDEQLELPAQMDLEVDVADAAVDVSTELKSLDRALGVYEYSGKKKGELV
jgi:hypothetical protein